MNTKMAVYGDIPLVVGLRCCLQYHTIVMVFALGIAQVSSRYFGLSDRLNPEQKEIQCVAEGLLYPCF